MDLSIGRFCGGAVVAAGVAWAARSRRWLSPGGGAAAGIVGTLTVGGGWWWGTLMVAFFATSSVLSTLGRRARGGQDETVRGDERDAVQVLANGGVPAALAIATAASPARSTPLLFGGFAGAVAAATADTWATELGRASPVSPRLIVGGRRVPPGTSGGITPHGSLASVAGSALVAALAALGAGRGWAPGSEERLLWGTLAAGVAGATADSLLGATVQAAYRCPRCGKPTERRVHGCGTRTVLVRGHPAITNDTVNGAATAIGGLVGVAVARAITLPLQSEGATGHAVTSLD